MTPNWSRPLVTLVPLFALAVLARGQVPSYSSEYLGPALGAAAMNARGQCVGMVTSPAVRGWAAGPGQPVTLLPLPPGRLSSWALDINDAGQIAGSVSSSISPEFGGMAAVWSPDGQGGYTVAELGMLPGHQRSEATALNDVGDVVGWSQAGMFRYPVLFAASGGLLDLSFTGIFDPRAINDQRVLVDGSFTAKRLDLNTMVVTDLGVPTGLPQNYLATSAAAINESNQVCGGAILPTSTSCDRLAARYSDGVGWEVFGSCGPFNAAHDINDQGDVVMRVGLEPYVRLEGLGTFRIEDLIQPTVGHWYVQYLYGLAINGARQIAVTATNPTTQQTGLLLLTPQDIGTPLCFGDGGGTPCPCNNEGGSGEGCANGGGQGAKLSASGSASVSAAGLVLRGAGLLAGQAGLYLQGNNGTNGGAGVAFGDGLRCAGGGVVRLQVRIANALGLSLTSIDVAARGGVSPGDVRTYQIWYRDAFNSPCGTGFNLSNGLELTWAP